MTRRCTRHRHGGGQPKPDIMWFFERLPRIVSTLNSRSYRYELSGLFEAPQFLVYRDSEGGHYDWHMDVGPTPPRKLSLTIQLTDPARYEVASFSSTSAPTTFPRQRTVAWSWVFRHYMIHRVTPITSGVRKAIVAWITGPGIQIGEKRVLGCLLAVAIGSY